MTGPTRENPTALLRPATNADAAKVRQLVFGVLAEFGLKPDPGATDVDLDDIQAAYQTRGGRFDVLQNNAGEIIGTVGLYPIDQNTLELRKMYLRPDCRGHGLGRLLLDHALAEARKLGFKRMTLETASVLKQAVALYVSYGFAPYQPGHMSCRCDQAYALDL